MKAHSVVVTNPTAEDLRRHLVGTGPCVRDPAPYRLVAVEGLDAGEFLHRLCAQDVQGLADGVVAPAAFLDAKGKVQVTCLVARLGGVHWLEVQAEQEPRLLALLERYHFTEKLRFAGRPSVCHERIDAGEPAAVVGRGVAAADAAGLRLEFTRRSVRSERRHTFAAAAVPVAPADDCAECLRMLAGLVRVGVETEPNTLALEADLDDHCSTTKGCYTGQEIVARIHTYGHVNRRLCLLQLGPGERIAAPVALLEPGDGIAVGRVLHAVPVPGRTARLGLGYLPKDFQAFGTQLTLDGGGAATVIGYEPLPA
ncbi:MAG: hypothetical protein JNL08_18680 [Planctomycetes bacterium]|nr:hypothetical protein [Planctomycetota bacterium]